MKNPIDRIYVGHEGLRTETEFVYGVEPLHDRILVSRLAQETRVGMIIIPDCARENSKFARVIAVGPGAWRDGYFSKTVVKRGDVVLVPGAGNKYPDWEEQDTILIQEGDIGAIVG